MIYIILGCIVLLNIVFLFLIMKNKNKNKNSSSAAPVATTVEEKSIETPNDFSDEYVKTQALGPSRTPASAPDHPMPMHHGKTEVLGGGISNLSESEKQAIRENAAPQSAVGETVILTPNNRSFAKPMTYFRSIEYYEDNQKKTFKWDENTPLTIGRDPNDSDLTISFDNFIGRKHALLYKKGDLYYLTDLDSKNGTFVNDKPLKGQTEVTLDQIFRIGQTEFILK